MPRIIQILTLILPVIVFLNFAQGASKRVKDVENVDTFLQFIPKEIETELGAVLPSDIPIGSLDAPVTVVDYSSFSCGYCRIGFDRLIMPIYDKYVKPGKVLLLMRDFPLDSFSFNASLLVRCYHSFTQKEEEILSLMEKLFVLCNKSDTKSGFNRQFEDIISSLFNSDSSKTSELKNCIDNQSTKNSVLNSKLFAIKHFNLSGVPTIYVDGVRYSGSFTAEGLSQRIDEALTSKGVLKGKK